MAQPFMFYDVLQVKRNANAEEIRAAYRKLSKQLHPDKRPSSEREQAQRDFQKLHQAYTILNDPTTRQQYDQECHDALSGRRHNNIPNATPQGMPFGMPPGPLFDFLFGTFHQRAQQQQHQTTFSFQFQPQQQQAPPPSQTEERDQRWVIEHETRLFRGLDQTMEERLEKSNLTTTLPLTLADLYRGGEFTITVQQRNLCQNCHGRGLSSEEVHMDVCKMCNGNGQLWTNQKCAVCHGHGICKPLKMSLLCPSCSGVRFKITPVQIQVTVEPGSHWSLSASGGATNQQNTKKIIPEKGHCLYVGTTAGDLIVQFVPKALLPTTTDSNNITVTTSIDDILKTVQLPTAFAHLPRDQWTVTEPLPKVYWFWRREGDDLHLYLPITLYEALTQISMNLIRLDGTSRTLQTERGKEVLNPNHTYVLENEGMPRFEKSEKGSLRFQIQILLPEARTNSTLDDNDCQLLAKLLNQTPLYQLFIDPVAANSTTTTTEKQRSIVLPAIEANDNNDDPEELLKNEK